MQLKSLAGVCLNDGVSIIIRMIVIASKRFSLQLHQKLLTQQLFTQQLLTQHRQCTAYFLVQTELDITWELLECALCFNNAKSQGC